MARTGEQTIRPQTIGFLLVPGFALMSYAAAIEPLRAANLISGKELYRWWHAAPRRQTGYGLERRRHHHRLRHRQAIATADMMFVCAGGNPAIFDDSACSPGSGGSRAKGVAIGGISGGPYIARQGRAAR